LVGSIVASDDGSIGAVAEPPVKPRWHRDTELVDLILKYAGEPSVPIKLGTDVIVSVRPGATVVIMGPTGSGKSSTTIGMLNAHDGPVVVLSRELPAEELAARAIGMQCDASWEDVLTGKVPRREMERVIFPRAYVLDRKDATLGALEAAIKAAQAEHPGERVLAAIDYLQIMESDKREERARIADVVARVDEIARSTRAVVLAISQMSRASSRAARTGEVIGADSTDGGAESAAIERAATVTLSLGASGPEREDGSRTVELSIGKSRMGGGDRVIPLTYWGRTGRCRIAGEARSAAEVKAERGGQRNAALVAAAVQAMLAGAERSSAPLTREQLDEHAVAAMGTCTKSIKAQARAALASKGLVVEVLRKTPRARHHLLWTPAKAAAAGIPLAKDGEA
jgi:ABC-type dipeptide/oligopeptide/nickel transport system ATPase subunit